MCIGFDRERELYKAELYKLSADREKCIMEYIDNICKQLCVPKRIFVGLDGKLVNNKDTFPQR